MKFIDRFTRRAEPASSQAGAGYEMNQHADSFRYGRPVAPQRLQMFEARQAWEAKRERLTREFVAKHGRLPSGRNLQPELGEPPPAPGVTIT